MGVRGTADDAKWEISYRWLHDQIDRATHRAIVMRQWTPSLKAGIEINPLADEVGLVANWRILSEGPRRPALIAGTSSDRIGTPSGQSWYLTVAKSLHRELGIPLAPYVGVAWSGAEDRVLIPFGASIGIGDRASAMILNDGVHTHGSVSIALGSRWTLTALAVRLEDPGFTIGSRF